MKKVIYFCSSIAIIFATISFTQPGLLDKFPPIQTYLDKVEGEKFVTYGVFEKEKMISQKISDNSITTIFENTDGVRNKTIYSNLDFRNLLRVSTSEVRETKKIIHLNFVFNYEITFTGYDENGNVDYTGKEAIVQCYIFSKDEDKILNIIKTWQN